MGRDVELSRKSMDRQIVQVKFIHKSKSHIQLQADWNQVSYLVEEYPQRYSSLHKMGSTQ